MRINPGRLDTKCGFYRETIIDDGMGSTTSEWAEIAGAPTWCRFEPLKGLEHIEANKVTAGHHAKITTRRCEDITTADEVSVYGHRWRIGSIEDWGRAGWQRLRIFRTT